MKKCIESLLPGGEDVEILIVDDGSTDGTGEIADAYERLYPSIVKVIHKKNGGHGSAVNAGLACASGLYYKVVDSDDWVKESAYLKILEVLRDIIAGDTTLDMLISNFVYEKEGEKKHKVMKYRHALPKDRIFGWNEVKHFHKGQYILMHSVIFRTKLLRECGLELPEHTFYVDNIFVFQPFPYVRTLYYLNVNFYRYFIGREDQSVNESVMISRIDQQLKVNHIMIDQYTQAVIETPRLERYMRNYLSIITTISSILCIRSKTPENLRKKQDVWKYMRQVNPSVYKKLRWNIFGIVMNLPGRPGRAFASFCYKIAQKIYGFN